MGLKKKYMGLKLGSHWCLGDVLEQFQWLHPLKILIQLALGEDQASISLKTTPQMIRTHKHWETLPRSSKWNAYKYLSEEIIY